MDTSIDGVIDWGDLYVEHVAAVSALALDLTPEQLATRVPGTPAWTAQQVVAHLAGGPADSASGRTEGAPGEEWTARHVAEREGRDVPTLLAEIRTHQDATAASARTARRPAVVWDIAVHHADLHEAFGRGAPPERFWRPVVDLVGPGRAPELVGVVEPYELFRGLFSRRSRAQMAAWGTGLDQDRLDAVCVFGARDDDQPVP